MENHQFKIGDVVTLKSGSPEMTITGEKNDFGIFYISLFDMNKYEMVTFHAHKNALVFVK